MPISKCQGVYLRIGNGGAGQSGLIGALANAFIQAQVSEGDADMPVLHLATEKCDFSISTEAAAPATSRLHY